MTYAIKLFRVFRFVFLCRLYRFFAHLLMNHTVFFSSVHKAGIEKKTFLGGVKFWGSKCNIRTLILVQTFEVRLAIIFASCIKKPVHYAIA